MDEVEWDDAKGEKQASLFRELCQNVRVREEHAKESERRQPGKGRGKDLQNGAGERNICQCNAKPVDYARIEVVGKLASTENNLRPGQGTQKYVGRHHRAQRPRLQVLAQEVAIQADAKSGVGQIEAECDV